MSLAGVARHPCLHLVVFRQQSPAAQLALDIDGAIAAQNFRTLSITVDDAVRAGSFPGPLRDPFDRILIAQALAHNHILVSNESLFDMYGVRRLW